MVQARRAFALVLASAALAVATPAAAQLPAPKGPVNDFAGVLGDAAERELTELLQAVENETSAEIAVATLTSLEGTSIEEYATKLFNAWGVGQSGKDNGVLVVVVPNAQSIRIEVGYGLEGILPDGLAGAIIRRDFAPAFKAGDYDAGMLTGVRSLADVVRKQQVLSAEERQNLATAERQAELDGRDPPMWVLEAIMGSLVALMMFLAGLALRTSSGSLLVFGGGGGLLLYAWLLNKSARASLAIVFALALLALGILAGGVPFWRRFARQLNRSGFSGQRPGSSGSGSGSSSRSSGFGGGRSGGGGASGRW